MSRNRETKHKAWEAVEELYKQHANDDQHVALDRYLLIDAISNKLASPPDSKPENYRKIAGYMTNFFIKNEMLTQKTDGKIYMPKNRVEQLKKGKLGFVLATRMV